MTEAWRRNMGKERIVQAAPWLVALGLLLVVWWLVPLDAAWQVLRRLGGAQLVLLALVNVAILLGLNGRWWLILRGQGQRVSFFKLLGYRLAAFGLSYFTPGPLIGGEPLQVVLVEREHNVPRTTAVAAVTLDKLLELLANFTFLLTGLVVILQQRLLPEAVAVRSLALLGLLLALPLTFLLATWTNRQPLTRLLDLIARLPLWRRRPQWQQRLRGAQETMRASEAEAADFCRRTPLALVLALAVSLMSLLLMLAEFWLMVSFLGISLTLVQLVTVMTAARVAILLLLPAGLGALEVSQALTYGALGLNPAVGISATLVIRARDVLLGSAGLWWGSRRLAARQPLRRL